MAKLTHIIAVLIVLMALFVLTGANGMAVISIVQSTIKATLFSVALYDMIKL